MQPFYNPGCQQKNSHMRPLIFLLIINTVCISCSKENTAGSKVEIYLLRDFGFVTGKCKVDPTASNIQDVATIQNDDILEYERNTRRFKLSDEGILKVKNSLTDFTPFAVTVDRRIIYYGLFKSSYSSASCDHSITMQNDWEDNSKIRMQLGYPGSQQGTGIDDQRNNQLLIGTLQKQHKLK